MPDIVSHQFYPSSCRISEYVSSLLGAGEGDTLPEPNIGHADLLKSFPAGVIVTGIELDTLNCLISRAKGYDTTEADFLTWSKSNQQKKFDYVVMNPPLPITGPGGISGQLHLISQPGISSSRSSIISSGAR